MAVRLLVGVLLVAILCVGISLLVRGISIVRNSPKLSGTIIITSTEKMNDPLLHAFAFDLSKHAVTGVGGDATSLGTLYSVSANGKYTTFVGNTADRFDAAIAHKISNGSIMQIYRATTENGLPPPSSAQCVTTDDSLLKTTPVISDDGRILYVASRQSNIVFDKLHPGVEPYSIHLVNVFASSTTDVIVATGTQPYWISNTSFYYLATDGVRLVDLAAGTSSDLVLPMETHANDKLAVSPDHSLVAIMLPDASKTFLFTMGEGGIVLKPVGSIAVRGFWLVFSPDGQTAAIQTAQGSDDSVGPFSNPSIVFYDTHTLKKLAASIALAPLQNDQLFMTTWK